MIELLFKATLLTAVSWLFYKFVIEKESFFALNRIYLIATLVLAFALPYVSLPELVEGQGFLSHWVEQTKTSTPAYSVTPIPQTEIKPPLMEDEKMAEKPSCREETLFVSPESSPPIPKQTSPKSAFQWLFWAYLSGVIILALHMISQIIAIIWRIARSQDKIPGIGYTIINSSTTQEPCSFFTYIFIDPERYDFDTYEQILAHEAIHIQQAHSIDLILAELATIILWFNPFIWLMRREVETNIEYQTDDLLLKEKAIQKKQYQMNLLKVATYQKPLSITTNYNQSLLKNRIHKMSTKKSNPHSYWKYAFILPVLFMTLLMMNKPLATFAQVDLDRHPFSVQESDQMFEDFGDFVIEEPQAQSWEEEGLEAQEVENEFIEGFERVQSVEESENNSDCLSLINAITDQDVSLVKRLLRSTDPNCVHKHTEVITHNRQHTMTIMNFETPLVSAAESGNMNILKLLIEFGADVNFHADGEETPLMAAAATGDLEVVKYLVKKGADIHTSSYGNGTALSAASLHGHTQVARYLLAQEEAKSTYADHSRKAGIASEPEETGINADSYGVGTALIAAVKNGETTTIDFLISEGADLNVDSYGVGTALIVAAKSGDSKTARQLISRGADLDIDSYGVGTALIAAIRHEQIDMIKLLISKGANLDINSYGVGTALIAAIKTENRDLVDYLISKGADLDTDSYGVGTALLVAVKNGDVETAKYLAREGADLDVNSYGVGTALIVAQKRGDLNMIKSLISLGADVNADSYGIGTALIIAAKKGDIDMVEHLIARGADPSINSYGVGTAFSVATEKKHFELAKYLLSKMERGSVKGRQQEY